MDTAPTLAMLAVAALTVLAAGEAQGNISHPFILEWGESGLIEPGNFNNPQAVALDPEGGIYVTDLGNMRVQKFNTTGDYITEWGGQGSDPGLFSAVAGIAVGQNSTVYVVDGQLNRVQHFDSEGVFIREWGQRGDIPGKFLLPNGITTDSAGNVYVVDTGNHRVQRFTPTGQYIDSLESHGTDQMVSPAGIAITLDGTVFVSDPGNKGIKKFGPDGAFIGTLDSSAGGTRMDPRGLAAAPDGNIYVADGNNGRVLLLDESGTAITIFGRMGIGEGQFRMSTDLALDPDGSLYVVDSGGHRMQKFGTPHTVQSEPSATPVQPVVQEPSSSNVRQAPAPVTPVEGDFTKPVILPPNDLVIEATGLLTRVDVGRAIATDESGIRSLEHNTADEFTIGINTVIWTAIDGAGNMAIATQTVTITDSEPPVISGISDVIVDATSPDKNVVDLGSPAATDTVGIISIENDAPEFYPIGRTAVTWTVTDIAGNTAAAVQLVSVIDSQKPVITVPDDITAEAESSEGTRIDVGEAAALDNDVVTTLSNDAPELFGIGNTTITWAASDASGNTATATQTVSIVDTTPPQITPPPDIIIEAASADSNTVDLGQPIVDDVQPVTIRNDASGLYPLGQTAITWTATDESGNTAQAVQVISVVDTAPPVLTAPPPVTAEATGLERNTVELGMATASDATGVGSVSSDAPESFPLGETVVVWTAIDAQGNQITAEQQVMIVDTTPPTITAPSDVTAEAIGTAGTSVDLGLPLADDLVAIHSVTSDAPESFPAGLTTVTWTVTDTSGNTARDLQTVLIIDTTAPVLNPPADITAEAAGPGGQSLQIGQAVASDELGSVEITNDAPELFPQGLTVVTWSATDLHGNTVQAIQNVTVQDTTPPVISAPQDITAEAAGPSGSAVDIGTAEAHDAVGVTLLGSDAPELFALGQTVVTWTATDYTGNAAQATQLVMITDKTAPVMLAPADITIEATSALNNTAQLVGASATDAVGVVSIYNDAPERFTVGQTVITWTAADGAGNTSTDTQTVSVIDTVAPVIYAGPQVSIEATGQSGNVVPLDAAVASDAVGVTSIQSDAPGSFPLGETVVVWTATDAQGNFVTAEQLVLVVDTTPPTIDAPANVTAEATSPDSTVVNLGEARASDTVALQSVTNDAPDLFALGDTLVTWTAIDLSGNGATSVQTVSVVDTTPPVLEAPSDITIEASSAAGNAVELAPIIATDAVGASSVWSDAPDSFPLGETVVTWTAADDADNRASIQQIVTILDTTPPVLSIPADIIIDAASLHTTVDVGQATGDDLIDSETIISNNSTGIFELGYTTIQWSTSDSFGNEVTATQTVEVQACGRPVDHYNLIMGGDEDDIMVGTTQPDLIFALGGDDIVSGGNGDDCIFGGEGDDILFGQGGDDGLAGNDGNDIIRGQSGIDILLGMSGLDVLDGGDDSDSCNAAEDDGDIVVKCESRPR